MRQLSWSRLLQWTLVLVALLSGLTAFMAMSEWPGLHMDAALFSTPVVNLANGEGWKFHGYLFRLAKMQDGSYNSHSLIYPLVFGILLRANTYEKIFFWTSVVNALTFAGYFLAPWLLFRGIPSWLRLVRALLLGITAGMIGVSLQGRPEQLVPLLLLLPLLFIGDNPITRRHGYLVLAAVHGLTLALLGLLSPLTSLVYGAGTSGWLAYSFKAKDVRAPIWQMAAVVAATAGIVILIVFSFCSFSLLDWLLNTFLYGSSDPSADWGTRLANFFGLNLSFDLPLWNLPVLLGLILLSFQLVGQSQISMFVFVGLVFVLLLRSAQSYVYAGFAPMILFLAFGERLSMGIPPWLRRFGRWVSFGYTGIYSLVFVRTLLMLSVYLTSGFSWRQARAEIRDLTKGIDQQKESIAYYWMRRPSFVVMGGSGRDWITAESSILNGNEQQLGPYEKYSGRRVTYLVFPQLGHIEKPPEQIQNGKRQYRLVHDGWTRERANILGLRLGGEAPGYNYALYKLVEPAD